MDSTDSVFPLAFFLLVSFHNLWILTCNITERVDVLGVCGKVLLVGGIWEDVRGCPVLYTPISSWLHNEHSTDQSWAHQQSWLHLCVVKKRGKMVEEKKRAAEGKCHVLMVTPPPLPLPLVPLTEGTECNQWCEQGHRGVCSAVQPGTWGGGTCFHCVF